jgi:4-amino-4-deoxychorismate lyase
MQNLEYLFKKSSLNLQKNMRILETIQIQDGKILQLSYHQARMNAARKQLWQCENVIDLASVLIIPSEHQSGIVRCRVVYQQEIEEIQFIPYQWKNIQKIKVVETSPIDYAIKWLERSVFTQLLQDNSEADELIITQNGWVSDATIANLAFWDGKQWFTPNTPLLKGTKRQYLLDTHQIKEKAIRIEDLNILRKYV